MKYLLMPITLFIWFLTAYFGLYFVVVGILLIHTISWFWLLLFYLPLFGLVFGITNGLPAILRLFILKLFDFNKLVCFLHGIAGTVGAILIIRELYIEPPTIVTSDLEIFFLKAMWNDAPIKTIFLLVPSLGLILSLIWSTVIIPFQHKKLIESLNN